MFGTWPEKGCSMHRGAENGATEKQLMAIFGWQTMKEAAHYTKMANQKRLAVSAMPLLSLDQTANNSLSAS
jgi:hypothetical protein